MLPAVWKNIFKVEHLDNARANTHWGKALLAVSIVEKDFLNQAP